MNKRNLLWPGRNTFRTAHAVLFFGILLLTLLWAMGVGAAPAAAASAAAMLAAVPGKAADTDRPTCRFTDETSAAAGAG